jgi:hypothetical protein
VVVVVIVVVVVMLISAPHTQVSHLRRPKTEGLKGCHPRTESILMPLYHILMN